MYILLIIINNQSSTSVLKMNDPIVDLEPILSSEDQQQILNIQNKQQNSMPLLNSQSLKQCMFNFKYNLMHTDLVHIPYLHRAKIDLGIDSEPAYLLGTAYDHATNNKFMQHFRSIVWMSYRSVSSNGKGDAGWGCMIRVVQMLYAQVIRRLNPSVSIYDIIELFKQGKNHILSLQNICAVGKIKQRWTGSNQILLAVSSILNEYRLVDKTKKSISTKNIKQININFNEQLYCEQLKIKNFQQMTFDKQFPQMIVITSKLVQQGNSYFPQIYSAHIKHLMRMPTFCGMIGGVSSQALFIVGFQDDKVIVLDPHYVQQQNQPQKVKYFKQTPRSLPFKFLCQSVSMCFLIKDIQQYKNWAAQLCHSYKIYHPYLMVGLDIQSPEDMIEKYRKRSQDFQTL